MKTNFLTLHNYLDAFSNMFKTPKKTCNRQSGSYLFCLVTMLGLFILPFNSKAVGAFQNNNTDYSVSYNDCSGVVTVKFRVFDDIAIDEWMVWCDVKVDNTTIFEWDRFYLNHANSVKLGDVTFYYDRNNTRMNVSFEKVGDSWWVKVTYDDLPDADLGGASTISISGWWDGLIDTNFEGWTRETNNQATIGTPSQLSASSNEYCDKIALSWTNNTNISCSNDKKSTLLYRKLKTSSDWPNDSIAEIPFPIENYDDHTAQVGVEYDYRIRHKFTPNPYRTGYSTYTSTSSPGRVKTVPDVPDLVTASQGNCDGTIDLAWNWSTASPDNFRIKRGSTSLPEISGNLRNFKDENRTRGTVYTYTIEAKNNCGYSQPSSAVTGISPIDPAKPAAAGFTISTSQVNGTVTLNWTATTGATGYEIERSLLGGGGSSFFTVDGSTLTWTDNSLKACEEYEYRLRATNNCVPNGALCDRVHTVQLQPILNNVFNPTSSLLASKGFFGNRVEISWSEVNPSNFIDFYKIYRKVQGSPDDSTVVVTLPAGSNFFIDNYTEAGVMYLYTIVAQSQCGNTSIFSNIAEAIGFRSPVGTVTGKVSYGGGIAVENVRISAESTSGFFGKSLAFNGSSHLQINDANSLDAAGQLLLEAWIKPDNYAGNFTLFEKAGSYSLKHIAGNYQFQVFKTSGGSVSLTLSNTEVVAGNFSHVAAQLKDGQLELFVNGIKKASQPAAGVDIVDNAADLFIGTNYSGIIDEVRVWNTGKSEENILQDYSRLMIGQEAGLRVYLRMNEGVGSYAYDISRVGTAYNRNHAVFSGNITWASDPADIPTASQLGVVAYTDQLGDYVLSIPYHAGGEIFKIQPSFLSHEFDPSTSTLFLGDGASVHAGINFLDKSSFTFSGSVNYKNTTCPVEGAQFKVDGAIVTTTNGSVVKTAANGSFAIQVPIGQHIVEIEKAGHVFSVGSLEHNFQEDLHLPNAFVNSTLIKIVGRVVGGRVEADKVPGFNKSKNNIGQAEITLTSQQGNGCSTHTIMTDAASGEYMLEVPPLRYVPTVTIPSNPTIDFGVLSLVDLSGVPVNLKSFDITADGDTIGELAYNKRLDYIYRVDPTITVWAADGVSPFIGDTILYYNDPVTNLPVEQNLKNNPLRWPVFRQQDDDFLYRCLIDISELYTNLSTGITDSVRTTDGVLKIANELSHLPDVELELKNADLGDRGKKLVYSFKPGTPNFNPNTSIPDYSYTRKFEIILITTAGKAIPWQPVASANIPTGGDAVYRAYLLGSRLVGQTFVIEGPQVPDYVLRDPPGSGSSASWEVGTTKTADNSWGWTFGTDVSTSDELNVGTKIQTGTGVATETEVKNDLTAGFSAQITGGRNGNQSVSITSTKEVSTSDGTDVAPGANSDVYIGKSRIVTFGGSEELAIIPNALLGQVEPLGGADAAGTGSGFSFGKKYGLTVVPEGYETHFKVSEYNIKNLLIPNLVNLRNTMLQSNPKYVSHLPVTHPYYGKNNDDPVFAKPGSGFTPSTDTPNSGEIADNSGPSYTFSPDADDLQDTLTGDSVRFFNIQIKEWEKAIRLNEWEKANINNITAIDSVRDAELEKLDSQYAAIKTAYFIAFVSSGVGATAGTLATVMVAVPGAATIGYAVFGVTTVSNIALAELASHYSEYILKRQRIETRFADIRSKALTPVNHSLTGGVTFNESMSHESSSTYETSVEFGMKAELLQEIGAKISNTGFGFTKGLELSYSSGQNWSRDTSESESVNYSLQVNEGDQLSVDVYQSMLGWGPIFKTKPGSATSCPHETATVSSYYKPGTELSATTLQIEKPTLSVSPSIITNVPSDQAAVFNLTLGNESEINYTQAYDLRTISASNPFGAIVRVDGVFAQTVEIPGSTSLNKVLTIQKGPGSVYQYDSILVVFTSQCQYTAGTGFNTDIADSVYISAHFLPTCSNVSMATPENQWVLNNSFNDTLPVAIVDYDINLADLEFLRVDYKPSEKPNWIGLQSYFKDTTGMNNPALKPIPNTTNFTLYDWDVSALPDGNYDLRIVSKCEFAEKTSVTHSGLMDRINPHVFGTPSPGDGILSPNDDISIKFNEAISLGAINPSFNFDIRGVTNGSDVDHSTSLSFDGINDYVEITGGVNLQRRDFTIEFSARRNALNTEQALISQGNHTSERLFIGFDAGNHLVFRINGQEVKSTATYTDNIWHYFAVSYDYENETALLYVADEVTTATVINNGNTSIIDDYTGFGPLVIGKDLTNNGSFFSGNFHGLRIWNNARSVNEFSLRKSILLSAAEPGLLYNWRIDEANGTQAKEHIRRRDATIVGPNWQVDPNGHAAEFDGVDDYLKLTTSDVNISPGMDFTIEFWFNTSQPGPATLFSNGTGSGLEADSLVSWQIELGADGKIRVRHRGTEFLTSSKNYADGAWHHFALVYTNTGNLSAFIDGNPRNSTQTTPLLQLGGTSMYLGAHGHTLAMTETIEDHFSGKMDEFRFWNLARKYDQISRDKQHRMNGNEPGLRLYLPFENYVTNASGLPVLTASFKEQIRDGVVNAAGASLGNLTPVIKIQRPVKNIPFNWSLNTDQIILTTSDEWRDDIENVTLDITVEGLKDLHGNTMESPVTWIAYIDKNQIVWQEDLLVFSKLKGENLSFTSAILNKGGAAKTFQISDIPEWLTVSPQSGTITPNSSITVSFTVAPDMNVGSYTVDISLLTDFGFAEKLAIELEVEGVKPNWTVNPADFEHSMSIIGRLRINDVISRDSRDVLVAMHGTEVRGVAQLEYVPSQDEFMVFMDVYGDPVGFNTSQPLDFYIWDASDGTVRTVTENRPPPSIDEFVPDTLIGSIAVPKRFITGNEISFDVAINNGWNWLGFPLQPEYPTDIDGILVTMNAIFSDEIKTVYPALLRSYGASFYTTTNQWIGTLSQIGPPNPTPGIEAEQLYKLKANAPDPGLLTMRGTIIDPSTRPITLINGWNWMGFISVRNQSITQALGNLDPEHGDLIKGKTQFATYDATAGWVGSLKTLRPGQGFLYRSLSATPKTFTFPIAGMFSNLNDDPKEGVFQLSGNAIDNATANQWTVRDAGVPNNMTLLGTFIDYCALGLGNGQYAIGAFDQLGNARAVAPVELLDGAEVFYLTLAAQHGNGERLALRLLNTESGAQTDLGTTLDYEADRHTGDLDRPFAIEINEETCLQINPVVAVSSLTAFPTLFTDGFTLAYQADKEDSDATVTLSNIWGQVVLTATWNLEEGYNQQRINLIGKGLAAGIYTVELRTNGQQESIKLLKAN